MTLNTVLITIQGAYLGTMVDRQTSELARESRVSGFLELGAEQTPLRLVDGYLAICRASL